MTQIDFYRARLEQKRGVLAAELELVEKALTSISAVPDLQEQSYLLERAGAFSNEQFRLSR